MGRRKSLRDTVTEIEEFYIVGHADDTIESLLNQFPDVNESVIIAIQNKTIAKRKKQILSQAESLLHKPAKGVIALTQAASEHIEANKGPAKIPSTRNSQCISKIK